MRGIYFKFLNLSPVDSEKLFHFRGHLGRGWRDLWLRFEVASGRALKLTYDHGEAGDNDSSSMVTIGLFFFTAYISFNLPRHWYFQKRCLATWDNNKEFYLVQGRRYGFYFYDWAFVWHFHAKAHESSSKDPWWMHQYIHLDELVFGKVEMLKAEICSIEDIHFKIGEKEFVMDSIEWIRYTRFRRFIPYSLYHRKSIGVDMKIEDPPKRAGKGENSWDCDDDGSYGLHRSWPHETPNYLKNRDIAAKQAVDIYVSSLFSDLKRYGGSDAERGVRLNQVYTFIGRKKDENTNDAEAAGMGQSPL